MTRSARRGSSNCTTNHNNGGPGKRRGPANVGPLQVQIANQNTEPLDQLIEPSLCRFECDELVLSIRRCWASDAADELRQFVFGLTELNMRALYEQSNWGWNDSQKRKELTGKTAQYLVVSDDRGENMGFVHFRFDMDSGIPVVYCYEIQLVEAVQRRGLGAHLMDILQKLAERFKMKKVILTVFKHNLGALSFYKKKLSFRQDATDPIEADYTILSKKVET